jgi:chromosome segregation ATPase
MSSLKEKAKTAEQIYDEIDEFYITSVYHGVFTDRTKGMTYREFVKLKEAKWVRLEDAEKEIDKLQTRLNTLQIAYDGLREQLEEQDWYHKIRTLENQSQELKQKLQTLYEEVTRYKPFWHKYNCNCFQCKWARMLSERRRNAMRGKERDARQ